MDSTLTQTMFMRGEVQLCICIHQAWIYTDFNSRTAWGSSTSSLYRKSQTAQISIPVLRGEVQQMDTWTCFGTRPFQFPYCVGKFNLYYVRYRKLIKLISIPVLRGEVQPFLVLYIIAKIIISIPVLRGEVQPASICNARFIYLSEHVFADRR